MKTIKMSEEEKQDIIKRFSEYLETAKFTKSSDTFKFDIGQNQEKAKATVIVTPEAYIKMSGLVQYNDKEVGWHGLVKRDPTDSKKFILEDIIVYPQYVTAATVTTDDTEYANWLQAHDDETFDKIKFHGHSHVNMGASPSGVDDSFYGSILRNLSGNDFYIFLIANKRGEIWINIYDYMTNTIYEKEDVNYMVCLSDGKKVNDWADDQSVEFIKEKTYPKSNILDSGIKTNRSKFGDYDDYGYGYDRYGYSKYDNILNKTPEKKTVGPNWNEKPTKNEIKKVLEKENKKGGRIWQ